MDISKANLDKHYYLDTVKEEKTIFSILDQKRAEDNSVVDTLELQ